MTCALFFLDVGNADCTAVAVEGGGLAAGHSLEKVYLPRGLIGRALKRLREYEVRREKDTPGYQQLQSDIEQLKAWYEKGTVAIAEIMAGQEPWTNGALSITAQHPSIFDLEDAERPLTENERSLVLDIRYGAFSVFLMGDLECDGLETLYARTAQRRPGSRPQVVKIPHHGAWPRNSETLCRFLWEMDAEVAVPSVGSTNFYRHVRPELFDVLDRMRRAPSRRLSRFLCTRMTRSCVLSAEACVARGDQGMETARKCAGFITITAEATGRYQVATETEHATTTSSLPYPACLASS